MQYKYALSNVNENILDVHLKEAELAANAVSHFHLMRFLKKGKDVQLQHVHKQGQKCNF